MHTANRRLGFTLIELMVVVTIIGVLASVSVVRFANTKERAVVAKMSTDLRTLATRQEVYFLDNERFSTDVMAVGFTPSPGLDLTIVQGDVSGWSATVTPSGATTPICAVFFANAAPVPPAEREGAVTCE